MKYLKKFNDIRFEIEESDSTKIRMYDVDEKVGYSSVTIKDNIFDKWNLHDDLEVDPIKNTKSLYILGISMRNRRTGYGSNLINYIEEYANKKGCEYITLSSITDALGFWKKMGYEVYSMGDYYSMYKKL
jgi:ribosomal protein S18 acetylase RimI-like enzyme